MTIRHWLNAQKPRNPRAWVILAVALAVVAVVPPAPVIAQPSAGLRSGRQSPEFTSADLELFVEDLGLDDDQRLLLQSAFSRYQQDFRVGAAAVRQQVSAMRVTVPEPDAARRRAIEEAQEASRRIREEMKRRSAEAPDAETRRRVMEEYAVQIREVHAKLRGAEPAVDVGESFRETQSRMDQVLATWDDERERLRLAFLADVMEFLNDAQLERWPVLERRLRRERALREGRLSGESLNLFDAVRDLEPAPPALSALDDLLAAYDIELDRALRAREAIFAMAAAVDPQADAAVAADHERRQIQARTAVRDVNLSYAERIGSELVPDERDRLRASINLAAFPRIYRPTPGVRLLRAAAEQTDLEEDVRSAVAALEDEYLQRLAVLNDRLRATTLRHEPAQQQLLLERRRSALESRRWDEIEDPIFAVMAERRKLDEEFVERLESVLTPEQMAALPRMLRRPRAAARRAEAGATTVERQNWVMDQFDQDKNGRLDAEELEALRAYLRRRDR